MAYSTPMFSVSYTTLGVVLIGVLTIVGSYLYVYFTKHRKSLYAEGFIRMPVKLLSALVIVVLLVTLDLENRHQKATRERQLRLSLSDFTRQVVVDRWEHDTAEEPELSGLYNDVHLGILSPSEEEMRQRMAKLGIPYHTRSENVKAWHFSTKFVQDMVNVIRNYRLERAFPINDTEARNRVIDTDYAGWFVCLRMYLAHPLVRNVWERYKYRHSNPEMTAWIQYYIIDPVKDRSHWETHRMQWEKMTSAAYRATD